MQNHHAIERTSPKGPGQKFIGTCFKCGKPGLTIADMNQPCENIVGISEDDAIIAAIEGPSDRLISREADAETANRAAQFLFKLLDDIDTADDVARADDAAFREMVRRIQRRRFEVAETDGYVVNLRASQVQP